MPSSEIPKDASSAAAPAEEEWPNLQELFSVLGELPQYFTKALLSDTVKPGLVGGSIGQEDTGCSGRELL